ncbi:hypothetical protein BS47DRAFT_1129044 [Hydnum rufescens UP504]|uniref:Uncharacterized protein n=1 Tax=Hydnum rufescens UP504 TaxID=1448309 RepID=A0A9P6AU62_9AGAM|nr:hypothetical protein BS47DRAFT_1129044 [Hydnum rufescens UP504]
MLMMGSLSTSVNPPYPTKPSSEQSNNAVPTRASSVFNSRTSSTSSDAEEDKDKTDELSADTTDDAGHTPTSWMRSEEPPSPDSSAISRGYGTSSEAQGGFMGSSSDRPPIISQNDHMPTAAGTGGNGPESREGRGVSRRLSQKTNLRSGSTPQSAASSSWVPINLNKKWEDLQKIETFTKSSKRASVLLSDMTSVSTNLLGTLSSALSPSSTPSPSVKPQQQQRRQSSSPSSPMSAPPYLPHVNKDSPG